MLTISSQGYSRAVRVGSHIHVSGVCQHYSCPYRSNFPLPSFPSVPCKTRFSVVNIPQTTANPPVPSLSCVGGNSAASQAVWALDIIEGALKALGSSMKDVVRTRVILSNRKDAEAVSEVHGWRMQCADVLPANTLIEATLYEDEFLVEIEAWAEVDCVTRGTVRLYKS